MKKIPAFLIALVCAAWNFHPAYPAVTLQVGQNFTGSTYGPDSDASPADANGAVGPAHFVEFLNGRFSVYDKSNGTRLQTMTDLDFWSAAGVSIPSTQGVSDPRVIFDSSSQRWFASMIDVHINSSRQRSNHFLLAVSQSADPTGSWSGVSIPTDPNNVLFADFPTLGLDQNGVYLGGDMFDRFGNPVGPSLISIPKADLLANPLSVANQVSFGSLSYTSRGDILQPAVTTGQPSTGEAVLAVGDLALDFQNHTTLLLSSVLNGGTANATLVNPATTLTVPAYTVPIDPSQPDGSSNLDNGDARFAAAVRRVGDVLYTTHAVEVNNRAAVRWYRINAATGALIEAGTLSDPTLDLFYPSIAANESGTVVIGCNGSSTSTYVSSYAAVGQIVNGALTFGGLTLLQSGSASYQFPDNTGTSRWGDYSATTVDPLDPTRFWTIQMVAVGTSAWATQITELLTAPDVPRLSVTASGQQLVVSWPASATAYQLQSSTSIGSSANWSAVSQNVSTQGNTSSVILNPSSAAVFFRLVSDSTNTAQIHN